MSSTSSVVSPAAGNAPQRKSLKERFLRASGWQLMGYGGTLVLRLASSLIMTRLLAPEAFGLMSIVVTISVIVALLADIGIRQAVVNSEHGDDPRMLDTAWTMQVARGFLIWAVCCVIGAGLHVAQRAGWLAGDSVYASPQLPLLILLGTLNTVVLGFETSRRFTADRHIEQKRVVQIELAAMAVSISTMIVVGWFTRSVWSIVIGTLIGSVCSTIAGHLWLPGPRNRFAWDPVYARQILHFGKWILASSLLYVLANNSDKLLLGAWVSSAVLGCFAIGQNLAQMLELAFSRIFSQVTGPAFSDVRRNEAHRLREVYLRLRLPFDTIFIGAAGFLFAVGPWLVDLMYDRRYAEAGTVLQILSFALIFARYGISNSAYVALHLPQAQAAVSLVRLVSFFIAVPWAYRVHGVQGAYWAIALHQIAVAPLVWMFDRRFGMFSWRHEFLTLAVWPVGWAVGAAFVKLATLVAH